MRVIHKKMFISIQFDDQDFVEVLGRSPQQEFLVDLKKVIPEDDRDFDSEERVWLVTNTEKYREIVKVLREHYFA